jgi:hypothetical protein
VHRDLSRDAERACFDECHAATGGNSFLLTDSRQPTAKTAAGHLELHWSLLDTPPVNNEVQDVGLAGSGHALIGQPQTTPVANENLVWTSTTLDVENQIPQYDGRISCVRTTSTTYI